MLLQEMHLNTNRYSRGLTSAGLALGIALIPVSAWAQAASSGSTQVSSQDKQYLEEIAQDSNYEIETSQLALQKSQSQDVREYARMVNHDHMALKQQIKAVDSKVGVEAPSGDGMSIADHAKLLELKALSGKAFDEAYIKGLVKGNAQSVKDAKDEYGSTSVTPVKALAERNLKLDEKHTEKAKQLAQVHHVDAQE